MNHLSFFKRLQYASYEVLQLFFPKIRATYLQPSFPYFSFCSVGKMVNVLSLFLVQTYILCAFWPRPVVSAVRLPPASFFTKWPCHGKIPQSFWFFICLHWVLERMRGTYLQTLFLPSIIFSGFSASLPYSLRSTCSSRTMAFVGLCSDWSSAGRCTISPLISLEIDISLTVFSAFLSPISHSFSNIHLFFALFWLPLLLSAWIVPS